jgi:hypothetical protein
MSHLDVLVNWISGNLLFAGLIDLASRDFTAALSPNSRHQNSARSIDDYRGVVVGLT